MSANCLGGARTDPSASVYITPTSSQNINTKYLVICVVPQCWLLPFNLVYYFGNQMKSVPSARRPRPAGADRYIPTCKHLYQNQFTCLLSLQTEICIIFCGIYYYVVYLYCNLCPEHPHWRHVLSARSSAHYQTRSGWEKCVTTSSSLYPYSSINHLSRIPLLFPSLEKNKYLLNEEKNVFIWHRIIHQEYKV